MPKQKVSRSFADDLALVMAPPPSERTFADDLAEVMGGIQPLDLTQVGADFGPLAQEVVGAQRPLVPWSPVAPTPRLTPSEMPIASDLEQTPAYAMTALPQPTATFAEDLAQVQAPPASGQQVSPTGETSVPPPSKAPLRFNPKTGEPIEPESSTYVTGDILKDWGVTSLNAILSVPETAIGLASLATMGLAAKATDEVGFKPTDWKRYLGQFYSADRQKKMQYVAGGKGLVDTAVRALQNPSVIAHAVVESLPSMYVGGAIGKGIIGGAGLVAAKWGRLAGSVAGGAGTGAAQVTSNKILTLLLNANKGPVIAGAMGEGIVTAGQNLESVRGQMPNRELTAGQTALVAGSGALTGFISMFGGTLARKLGVLDANTLLAGGMVNAAARKNLARAIILGGIQEGGEEFFQSYQEQIAQNVAQGKDPWDGVNEAAVLGAFAGVVMSGGAQLTGVGKGLLEQRKEAKRDAAPVDFLAEQAFANGPGAFEKPIIPRIAKLQGQVAPVAAALEQSLAQGQPPGPPSLAAPDNPEWARQQDIEADADTRVETAKVIEALLRRGFLAPLVANNTELRKAAKLVQGGSSMLPAQIAVLPSGAIVTENHGTVDEEDWTVIRENTASGPTIFAYGATGEVRELAVRGKAGADLGRLLANLVAGTAVVQRSPEAPPAPPASLGIPTPETGPMAAPVPEVAPAVQPVAGVAPVAASPAELTDEELIRQMEAVMTGQAAAPAPAVTPPVTPTATAVPPAAPTGSAPTAITRKMESQLKKLGYTPEQIAIMPPAEAQAILAAEAAKNPPPPPAAPTPAPAAAPAAAAPAPPLDPLVAALSQAAQGLMDAANAIKGTPTEKSPPQTLVPTAPSVVEPTPAPTPVTPEISPEKSPAKTLAAEKSPAAKSPAKPAAPEPAMPPAPKAEAPRERKPTELPADLYRQVDARTIKQAPKVYQFKESDAKGETGRLRHVTKWDQVSGAVTPVLLHERANGDLYVADGHQRVALAQRLIAAGESVPLLYAIVLRETDGFDAAEVRRIAALANVRQNSASPVDIAKLLREAPLSPEEEATIPRGNIEGERFRQAQGLSKLGDAAFSAVVNGELDPIQAQFVGEILTEPAQQIAAIRALIAADLPNAYQAERFVKELRNEGFVTETQTDLFGEQAVANALTKERAQVLDAVRKLLGSQKSAFANAFRNRAELEAAGNVLNVGANERLAALAARQKVLLEAFADKAGSQTQQAIREAARKVHAKEISAKDAAPDVIGALERDFRGNPPPSGSEPVDEGPRGPAPPEPGVGPEAEPAPAVKPTNPAKKPTAAKKAKKAASYGMAKLESELGRATLDELLEAGDFRYENGKLQVRGVSDSARSAGKDIWYPATLTDFQGWLSSPDALGDDPTESWRAIVGDARARIKTAAPPAEPALEAPRAGIKPKDFKPNSAAWKAAMARYGDLPKLDVPTPALLDALPIKEVLRRFMAVRYERLTRYAHDGSKLPVLAENDRAYADYVMNRDDVVEFVDENGVYAWRTKDLDDVASPEEAAQILKAAGEMLKQQPQFDMPPLVLTGEVGPPAEKQASIFDVSPQSQEKIDAIRQEREELYKKLGKEFDTLTMGPFNPEVAKLAVQLMRNYAKEGYVRFSDVVGRLVHDIGSAKVQVLSDYLNTAWNIVHKEKVDTLETLKTATPMPPQTAPTTTPVVDQTPVSVVRGKIQGLSAVDQKVLDDHGLTVQVGSGGSILLTGRTYDLQPKLKELGGKLTAIGKTHVWELDPAGFRGVLTHVSGLPLPKGRPALPRAYWTVDPRLSQLRKDAEGRDDNSGLVGDPRTNLLPHIVRLIDEGGQKRKIPQFILDEQIEDAYRIASTYNANDKHRKMFMLASDPGSGKTFVLGAAIAQMKEYGAESITYVTQNQALIRQIKRDLKQLDLEDVNFLSYDQLRESDPHPTDVFILDESHKAKNIVEHIPTAVKAQEWMKLANFTVFSSATPYEDPTQMRYLTSTDIFKREFSDFESFAFAFGATPRVKPKKGGKTEDVKLDPIWAPTRTSEADAAASRAWLAKTGMFASRRIRLPEGQVDSRLVKVTVPDHESLIYDAVVQAAATVEARQKLEGIEHAWMVNFQKRLLEASKVTQAIIEAKAALDRKRFPVVFVETKAERNYNIPDIVEKDRDYKEMAQQYRAQKLSPPPRSTWSRGKDDKTPLPPAGIVAMLEQFMADQGESNIVIPPVEEVFMTHFGRDKVAVYTGSVGDTRAEQNLEDWRKGDKPILVVTMAKGGTGLSLHDTEGNHPTTQININLPWTGTNVLQVSQRTARYGLATNAEIEWLFADNILMDRILASRVGTRMSSLGATVHGLPSVQAGQVQEWNLDGAPFSEIARLNKLMSDQEVAALEEAETPDGELAYMTEEGEEETGEETGEEEAYMAAPRGPGAPPPHLFGLPGKAPTGEPLKALPLPEAVELADALMGEGHIRIVKHFRTKGQLGSFNADPAKYGIKLHAGLFTKAKVQELASALLHEIGHLTDWMPDRFIKRGNLLGRILSVTSMFRDHHFTRPDGTTVALADVKDDLIQLSAQWRPWNRASSPPSFIKYRDSAVELYADALSALYNSPGLVQRVAPTFYAEFFTYLDRKPEVSSAYFDIQARLAGDPVNVLAHYQNRMETMMDVGNTMSVDLQQRRLAAKAKMDADWWLHLRSDFIDLDVPFQDRVRADSKAGIYVTPDQNPTFASEERRQVPGKQKRIAEKYFQPIDEGLHAIGMSRAQFGTILMYERVALGDRSELANPKGTDPQRALAAYAGLQQTWTPDHAREVRRLLDLFRAGVNEVTTDAYERGQLYTSTQFEKMRENPAYATYQVLDHIAESVTANIYHQIGTFKAINNPLDATIAKMLVTIRATEDNHTRILMDDFLAQPQHQDAIEPAARYFAGPAVGWRFKPPTAEAKLRGHTELVMLKRKGKWEGRYMDPYIARSWSSWTVDRRNVILDTLRLVNGRFFRPLFITYNVGFQAYNLFRDFYRFWKNIPGMTLGRAFKRYYQALDIAKIRAFGLPENPTARQKAAQEFIWEAEKSALLGITYNELHDQHSLSEQHIDNLLSAAHVPGYGKQPIVRPVLRPLLAVLNTIKATGDLIETLPKVGGIIEFMGDGSISEIPADQRSFIRRKVGSPDFTTTSFYKPITNEVLLFSNAIIQAVRSDFEVMTEPTTRTGYWFKTVSVNILPKLLMAAASMGLLGEALRRMLAASSEYDKTNYIIIPLHEDAKGNVLSIKVPQDDMGRLLTGLLWKGLGLARGRTDVIETLQNVADYTGGQLPNVSPIFNLVRSTATYATGGNPRDAFRGRNVLSDQEQIARGWPAFKKFTGWEFQQLGGGILYKWYNNEAFPKEKTWGQRVVGLPLTGNLVGRFVSIGQQGRAEEVRAAAKGPGQEEARRGLDEKSAVFNMLRARQRGGQSGGNADALAARVARDLYPNDRALRQDRQDNIKSRIVMGLKRGPGDSFADAVMSAGSVVQKVAALQEVRRQKGLAQFPTWLRDARRSGIVSDSVYQAYQRSLVSTR